MENMVIGIEGMVGSGKTSICKELVKVIPNCIFVDASEIYRGIVEALAKSGLDIQEIKKNVSNINPMDLMNKLKVEFRIEDNITQIYIDGKKVSKEIISNAKNSLGVSIMAANSNNESLYEFARNILDNYRKKYNIIFSARDIVTIYPNMTCHLYITADFSERVQRRYNQYNGVYTIHEIEDMIYKRDKLHEDSGFNKLCDKSITIDTTKCKNVKESSEKVLNDLNNFLKLNKLPILTKVKI